MAVRLKVTYTDGHTETVLATPRAQVETERHFAGLADTQKVETSFYLAWASLKWGKKEERSFDDWLDAIVDIEEAQEVVDPTPATPPPTTSSV